MIVRRNLDSFHPKDNSFWYQHKLTDVLKNSIFKTTPSLETKKIIINRPMNMRLIFFRTGAQSDTEDLASELQSLSSTQQGELLKLCRHERAGDPEMRESMSNAANGCEPGTCLLYRS